jgi:methionyl-tRNA formyltransferase
VRILFMGTPEFAVPSLKALVGEHEVVGVVTQPDRRAGRGQRVVFSPIKQAALEYDLPVLQPEKVNQPEVMEQLEALGADLLLRISCAFLSALSFSSGVKTGSDINVHLLC